MLGVIPIRILHAPPDLGAQDFSLFNQIRLVKVVDVNGCRCARARIVIRSSSANGMRHRLPGLIEPQQAWICECTRVKQQRLFSGEIGSRVVGSRRFDSQRKPIGFASSLTAVIHTLRVAVSPGVGVTHLRYAVGKA